jgi:hypothetical protein
MVSVLATTRLGASGCREELRLSDHARAPCRGSSFAGTDPVPQLGWKTLRLSGQQDLDYPRPDLLASREPRFRFNRQKDNDVSGERSPSLYDR